MPSQLPRFTLRIDPVLIKKIRYIAEENGRSANKELEQIIKKVVAEYEYCNGPIPVDES